MANTNNISSNIIKQSLKRALEDALEGKELVDTNVSQHKLWDKDKLILIFYIGIGDLLQTQKMYEVLAHMKSEIEHMFDESVKSIMIPVRDNNTIRVEPIYMQTISNNEDNNRLREVINNLEKAVNNLYDTQIA